MSDIYAEFGVNNAVISSSDPVEHEQNMLALDVRTRDGDDEVILNTGSDEEGTDEELPDGSEDGGEQEEEEETEEGSEEESESDLEGFAPLGEPSEELKGASAAIDEYAEGFASLQAQAIERGLDPEVAQSIIDTVDAGDEITDAQYKAMEAAGYSRTFVKSYLSGQEAITQGYVAAIKGYAGGEAQFDAVMSHLKSTNPDAVETLMGAIERQDLATVRTVINLGMESRTKKFGTAPQRNISRRAPASAPRSSAKAQEGFESKSEMTKAMSDKRYGRDAAYTREVEQKVVASSW